MVLKSPSWKTTFPANTGPGKVRYLPSPSRPLRRLPTQFPAKRAPAIPSNLQWPPSKTTRKYAKAYGFPLRRGNVSRTAMDILVAVLMNAQLQDSVLENEESTIINRGPAIDNRQWQLAHSCDYWTPSGEQWWQYGTAIDFSTHPTTHVRGQVNEQFYDDNYPPNTAPQPHEDSLIVYSRNINPPLPLPKGQMDIMTWRLYTGVATQLAPVVRYQYGISPKVKGYQRLPEPRFRPWSNRAYNDKIGLEISPDAAREIDGKGRQDDKKMGLPRGYYMVFRAIADALGETVELIDLLADAAGFRYASPHADSVLQAKANFLFHQGGFEKITWDALYDEIMENAYEDVLYGALGRGLKRRARADGRLVGYQLGPAL